MAIPADRQHETCEASHPDSGRAVNAPYRQAIGSLMYLSVATRPDITYAVNKISQFLEQPTKAHWNKVKRILKYLKGTSRHGLYYENESNAKIHVYSDADYARDTETRRSSTGYVLKLGSSTITWSSQRQKIVVLSTTEAEYVAACQAVKELTWVKRLFRNLTPTTQTTVLHIDSQSAMRLIKNPEFHKRSKHIDVKYHFIREMYASKQFTLEYIPTNEQQADIFTKPLTKEAFQHQRDMLRVIDGSNGH